MNASAPDPTPSRHDVQFYDDDAFLADAVGKFLWVGLARTAAAVVIATPEHAAEIERRLSGQGVDLPRLRDEGRLRFLDARATLQELLVDGEPDEERFDQTVGRLVAEGCRRHGELRAFGEMVDLLAAEGDHTGAQALEGLWNKLLVGRPAHLLCGYRMLHFAHTPDGEAFRHACAAHSRVMPSDGFAAADGHEQRIIAELEQQARALHAASAVRRQV